MQFVTEKTTKPKNLRESAISVPKTIYGTKILGKDIEIDNSYYADSFYANSLAKMLKHQHPLIHTWLVLSCISICFLSAWLFMAS